MPAGCRATWTAGALIALASGACHRPREPDASARSSAGPSSPASGAFDSARPEPPSPSLEARRAAPVGCRAISIEGQAKIGSGIVTRTTPLNSAEWISLEPASKLVVKHTSSGREFEIRGPARAIVCPAGDETVVLSGGTLRTAAHAGVRPGALVLLATRMGVLEYGDADLELSVSSDAARIRVFSGDAWLTPLFGARRAGPEHATAAGKLAAFGSPRGNPSMAAAECRQSAQAAADSARTVLEPSLTDASLGERAATQLRARKHARAVCASALAWLGSSGDSAQIEALSASIHESERVFTRIPEPRAQAGR